MAKKNLVRKKKTAGTFIRLEPEFKKRAQVYAIENDITLTKLFIDSVEEKMTK